MDRNKAPNGFKSPLVSVRSTTQILNLFDKKVTNVNDKRTEKSAPESIEKTCTNEETSIEKETGKIVFNVVFGKKSTKKHKTWEGDGLLEVCGNVAVLKGMDGNILGKTRVKGMNLTEGQIISMGNKEIEIIEKASKVSCISNNLCEKESNVEPPQKKMKSIASHSFVPVHSRGITLNYEPLVMPYPSATVQWTTEGTIDPQEVSVDPCLTAVLRPHQRLGVIFLYQCVMGMNIISNCYVGAILADEMGLGKTLQCIALIWTLLKKGPYGNPVLKRVLVVAPSSLCNNWNKEFLRWLGCHRISVYIVSAKKKPRDFTKLSRVPVMIISYEMFVKQYDEVNQIRFDMLICDEGHRLKNRAVKVSQLLNQLDCKRRILLTGTPMQNDLQEFYSLVNFVNPGILGSSTLYKTYYEGPIIASQCPNASEDELLLGQERAKELNERTKSFILRRTQKTIDKYLPQKHELVIFCRLSPQQDKIYTSIIDRWFDSMTLPNGSISQLAIITVLKKICNHPSLLMNDKSDVIGAIDKKLINDFFSHTQSEYSGKITILQALLQNLKISSEKLVLVSYFTQTLDLLEKVCRAEHLKYCRLDGSTPVASRTNMIEQFNLKTSDHHVFLLSAKAGGTGLNLPGASRLILFDSDWNPATDAQAMARIWRDGQKRSVYIYRLLTSGTIEEKIYQRQICKTNLSEAVVDKSNFATMKLSSDELKDLFTLDRNTSSLTHDLMKCSCSGQGNVNRVKLQPKESRDYQFTLQSMALQDNHLTISQLFNWQHYGQPLPLDLLQELMLTKVSENITYIFKNSIE